MNSTKPYLIRAIHEWCSDQGYTPYLVVEADEHLRAPKESISDNKIVLNVSLEATQNLHLGNDEISFQARFSGKAFPVRAPVGAVLAIYARENGQGMTFEYEPPTAAEDGGVMTADTRPTPTLSAVPSTPGGDDNEPPAEKGGDESPATQRDNGDIRGHGHSHDGDDDDDNDNDPSGGGAPPKAPPRLTRVK